MMVIILVVLVVLIYYVKRLGVYDKIGIMQENARLLACVVFWFCAVLPVLLTPSSSHFPKATSARLITWLLLFMLACELVIV